MDTKNLSDYTGCSASHDFRTMIVLSCHIDKLQRTYRVCGTMQQVLISCKNFLRGTSVRGAVQRGGKYTCHTKRKKTSTLDRPLTCIASSYFTSSIFKKIRVLSSTYYSRNSRSEKQTAASGLTEPVNRHKRMCDCEEFIFRETGTPFDLRGHS